MSKINLLPNHLINQIAAGEVIDRPSSVVKELIENSIDAGADSLIIEITAQEESFNLKITDNGSGMDETDAKLSLKRHATSKINSLSDLQNINTLGFRGEALASISSVSEFELKTKTQELTSGIHLIAHGGTISSSTPIGMDKGTEIIVNNLFFNTPARRKFLKKPELEFKYCSDVVINQAILYPHIRFRLIYNGEIEFDLFPTPDEKVRITDILGKTISSELIPVQYLGSEIKLSGYICKPSIARSNRNLQFLYVNNRDIKSHVLSWAAKQAYKTLLPKEKHPIFILRFELSQNLVDPNVHPRKLEVKFLDEREIFKVLTRACEHSLQTNLLSTELNSSLPENFHRDLKLTKNPTSQTSQISQPETYNILSKVLTPSLFQTETKAGDLPSPENPIPISSSESITETQNHPDIYNLKSEPKLTFSESKITALTQLENSFILATIKLCENPEQVIIIDQHAAHEKIKYTEFLDQISNNTVPIQQMLSPLLFDLNLREHQLLSQKSAALEKLGFSFQPFGPNTFALYTTPSIFTFKNLNQIILELLDNLSNEPLNNLQELTEKQLHKSAALLACRTSVKFGDPLTLTEQQNLLDQLIKIPNYATCPHGRPTHIIIPKSELLSRFGRNYV